MAENDIKKTNPKGKCEVCDKEMLKSSLKMHMKSQHDKKEDISKKNEESNKSSEQDDNKEQDDSEKTEETIEKIEPTTVTKRVKVVNDLINLDTKELESLLENEEEFLDAVEMVEDAEMLANLDVDLSVNESMVNFIENPKNYKSDYAKTLELEKTLEETNKQINEKSNVVQELENAKKTITFLRNMTHKDRKYIKTLEKEISNNAKELKDLAKKCKTSKETVRKLEESLNSNRDLLAKATSENVQVKIKMNTKESLETVTNKNITEEVVVIEDDTHVRNVLACEKCQLVAKSKEELMGHNKFIHLDCHVCRKHCDTATELNAHIEHVHNIKPFDCEWCLVSFPNHTGFEVHRQEKHGISHLRKCDKCPSQFQNKEQLLNHVNSEHVSHQHKCDKCPSKFQKKEQLQNHIINKHVIKCIFNACGLITDTEDDMIKHLDEDHFVNASSEDKETNSKPKQRECKYFKQGRCFKGNQCKFEHTPSSHKCEKCGFSANTSESLETHMKFKHGNEIQTKSTRPCRNGDQCIHKAQNRCKFLHKETLNRQTNIENSNKRQTNNKTNQRCTRGENCSFKARGICYYYHDGVGVQASREDGNIKSAKVELWCKFQDKCTSSECRFKHFESNFAQKTATRQNSTLGEWLQKK